MIFSQKLKVVSAAFLTIALVGGASAANAAAPVPLDPQSNGSEGALYVYDEDLVLIDDPNHVFARDESIFASTSPTDSMEMVIPNPTKVTESTQLFQFFSSAESLRGAGRNAWEAYTSPTPFDARVDTGILLPDITPGNLGTNNGIGGDGIFANVGGTYYLGVAFTKYNGVSIDTLLYRTMTILPGQKYTLSPVEFQGAPSVPTAPTEAQLAAAAGTAADMPNLVAPVAADSTTLTIDAGVANANKTLNVGAYSTYTDLGTVTLDSAGRGTVNVAALADNSAHKLVLWETDGTLVAFGSFTMNYTSVAGSSNPLIVAVTTSEKFELVAPAAGTVDLGAVRRNATTAPVALGQFSVIDDRSNMLGWDLNVSANDFVNGANTIAKNALGYQARAAGTLPAGVALGTAKAAGSGSFGTVASGAAQSSTTEAGTAFDLDLTFKSPIDATTGTYSSTLTLDLQSK